MFIHFVQKKENYILKIYLIGYKPVLFQVQILTFTEKVKIEPYHCKVINWL